MIVVMIVVVIMASTTTTTAPVIIIIVIIMASAATVATAIIVVVIIVIAAVVSAASAVIVQEVAIAVADLKAGRGVVAGTDSLGFLLQNVTGFPVVDDLQFHLAPDRFDLRFGQSALDFDPRKAVLLESVDHLIGHVLRMRRGATHEDGGGKDKSASHDRSFLSYLMDD